MALPTMNALSKRSEPVPKQDAWTADCRCWFRQCQAPAVMFWFRPPMAPAAPGAPPFHAAALRFGGLGTFLFLRRLKLPRRCGVFAVWVWVLFLLWEGGLCG